MLIHEETPTGEQWTYELKLDGFRIEAVRMEDRVILYSKQGKLLTSQIARELEKLPPGEHTVLTLQSKNGPRFAPMSTHQQTHFGGYWQFRQNDQIIPVLIKSLDYFWVAHNSTV